ncbi:SWPV2-ORF061 [Shearwaterpox virus]|uniref:SWPV2-ORF061 n=1 Tax=Shearwaterpox virus TaxID=1974596 RepID=A0A1V0QG36_CNPV|nr:SWPV2-ORF061 [Shearwaterpox virus]QRM15695.1 semaphorin-like protein [Penguinpox virus 2]QRM16025.1 semaphorin-like protein [Albatrosspox virus]
MNVVLLLLVLLPYSISENLVSPRIRVNVTRYNNTKLFDFKTSLYDVVTYYKNESSVLVGVTNMLHIFNFIDGKETSIDFTPEKNPLETTAKTPGKHEYSNRNYITFIGTYQNKTMVCGTNACSPKCWFLIGNNKTTGPSGLGFAPYKFNSSNDDMVLVDGEDVYSTIPKYEHLPKKFRRILGRNELYTSDSVIKNPTFIKMVSLNESASINDTIYTFFLENNQSKVFRVCKGDKGSTGSMSSSKWSTLLKSVLVCKDSYNRSFNKLVDVFVLQDTNTRVYFYGLFMNEWGFSAVCVFDFKNIQHNFNTSPLKGFTGKMPSTKPGTCLTGSTPDETFKVIDQYPETSMSVKGRMLFESQYSYTHLVVSTKKVSHHKKSYNIIVLYLSTNNGRVHKVVVYERGAICVMEMSLKSYDSPILSMILDNSTKLYVSYNDTIIQLPVAFCELYGKTCDECVMSRDPHCGWKNKECVYGDGGKKILQDSLLDVPRNICSSSKVKHEYLNRTVMLHPSSYHILVCFTVSFQAKYRWMKDNSTIKECLVGTEECSHMIPKVNSNFGQYICVSEEGWNSMISSVDNIVPMTRR